MCGLNVNQWFQHEEWKKDQSNIYKHAFHQNLNHKCLSFWSRDANMMLNIHADTLVKLSWSYREMGRGGASDHIKGSTVCCVSGDGMVEGEETWASETTTSALRWPVESPSQWKGDHLSRQELCTKTRTHSGQEGLVLSEWQKQRGQRGFFSRPFCCLTEWKTGLNHTGQTHTVRVRTHVCWQHSTDHIHALIHEQRQLSPAKTIYRFVN